MPARRTNFDRSQETRGQLISAARSLFLEKGYAGAATPEVVERAGVTRGALYHHYKDKQALFQAVVEAEAAQIAGQIAAGSAGSDDPLRALLDGARAYFAAMRDPGRVRLMLIEAPAVLGPETLREIDMETGGRALQQGIEDAIGATGTPATAATLADLVSAMFDRAVLACNAGGDRAAYEAEIERILAILVRRDPGA